MGGCRCSFRECTNTTKTENIHFFHYPVKQKDRCRQWIENAQKPQFCDLEEEQLRNKVICDQHFENKWFPNPQKKRLLQGAIPTLLGKYYNDISNGIHTKERISTELPVFVPHDQDIQVLPANDDGTVFVLDTEAMFTKSQKIESYVYQNGTLLPSALVSSTLTSNQNIKSHSLPKLKESIVLKELTQEVVLPKQHIVESHVAVEPGEIMVKAEVPEYTEKSCDSQMRSISQEEEEYEVMPKRVATEGNVMRNSVKQQRDDSILDKTYLRKIKQHSRDIASIKKLLKEKTLTDKPNIATILNIMKERLPASLFTIVTLNLNQECELNEDDVEFFTMVHRTSPEVYQLLTEKFKWNLPSVDVVDSSE